MTAATIDIKSDKVGTEDTPPPPLLALPCEANVQIFGGTFAANNSNGRAVPATSSAALMLWGRVERQVNNLSSNSPFGAAGAQNVLIRPGPYYFSSDGTVTASMVGQMVYAIDDNTVTTNPTKAGVTYWLPLAGMVQPPGVGDFGFIPTDSTKIPVYVGFPSPSSMVMHATIAIPLATIQAQTSGTAFNLGPVMPSNAKLLGAEVNVLTAISGGAIATATLSLSGGTDAATSILAATNVFTGAPTPAAAPGTNPYQARGGQQLKATLTTTGGALSTATAGSLSVDIFYTIAQ